MIKKVLLLGASVMLGILLAGCWMNDDDDVDSGSSASSAPVDNAEVVEGGIATRSTPSLVSRQVYINVYRSPNDPVETERWFYDSTNALADYTVTTGKDLAGGAYQEVVYEFSSDPKFSKTKTGDRSMYDTDTFVSTYNPESNSLYTGKYIYRYDADFNCTAGAYIARGASTITSGCFTAEYGPYGYTSFTEAERGSFSMSGNVYTISPNLGSVSEYRVCEYDSSVQGYTRESFYRSATESDSNLLVRYTCVYDGVQMPLREVKYEPLSVADAAGGSAGSYVATMDSGNDGTVNNDSSAANSSYSHPTVYVFDTNSRGQITVQKSYRYVGSAAIPTASSVTNNDYSSDNELSVITREFDGHGRKTKEVETSYGNKVKTVVRYYDEGTTDANGLASETTYDGNDLMVSRSTYELTAFQYAAASGSSTPLSSYTASAGDVETYETKNYEYSTTRSYHGTISPWGIAVKRPRTIHWCER